MHEITNLGIIFIVKTLWPTWSDGAELKLSDNEIIKILTDYRNAHKNGNSTDMMKVIAQANLAKS
jgi:hypothetical protein